MKFLVCLYALACCQVAAADFMIVPPGLSPGTQYRLVFVTSGTRNAVSSNIEDYNAFVTSQANQVPSLVSLGTTWHAIGSTFSVHASDNTGTNPSSLGVPVYNLGGASVAASNVDLWDGSLLAPIMFDQTGASQLTATAWTGSLTNGNRDIELFFGDTFVITGSPGSTTDLWIEGQANNPAGAHSLYAISGILLAVPEPSSLMLVGFATFGAFITCRRKDHS